MLLSLLFAGLGEFASGKVELNRFLSNSETHALCVHSTGVKMWSSFDSALLMAVPIGKARRPARQTSAGLSGAMIDSYCTMWEEALGVVADI